MKREIPHDEFFDLILSTLSERDKNMVKLLKQPLLNILQEELSLGNEIEEVFSDQILYVILGKPFKSHIRTNLQNISYNEVNDPHFWKAEYFDRKNWHILACKY